MSFKSTIAALAASPFLLSGAAFAGPYVNLEAQIGYEGGADKFGYYVSVGPTVGHTEAADEFGDVEIAGYVGATYQVADSTGLYGEVYGATNDDDIDFSGKVGVKFTF